MNSYSCSSLNCNVAATMIQSRGVKHSSPHRPDPTCGAPHTPDLNAAVRQGVVTAVRVSAATAHTLLSTVIPTDPPPNSQPPLGARYARQHSFTVQIQPMGHISRCPNLEFSETKKRAGFHFICCTSKYKIVLGVCDSCFLSIVPSCYYRSLPIFYQQIK